MSDKSELKVFLDEGARIDLRTPEELEEEEEEEEEDDGDNPD